MKALRREGRFNKDMKRLMRRGYDLARLVTILHALTGKPELPFSARPHLLQGEWFGYWECHIAPDWLLIYRVSDGEVVLARTGTHADLFE
jgi:mRNA interferase YafQ